MEENRSVCFLLTHRVYVASLTSAHCGLLSVTFDTNTSVSCKLVINLLTVLWSQICINILQMPYLLFTSYHM